MEKGKYIKVELKDGSEHVVLAANASFYKNQGAKISEPTKKEIEEVFGKETETSKTPVEDTPEYNEVVTELTNLTARKAELEVELYAVKAENETLKAENEMLKAENEMLKAENDKKTENKK